MRDFMTVFGYTFYQSAKKKSFIITTVILLLLAAILLSIPGIIRAVDKDKKDGSAKPAAVTTATVEKKGTVYFEDEQGIFKNEMDQFASAFAGYEFSPVSKDQTGKIQEEIKEDKTKALIAVEEKDGVPYFNYWVKQQGTGISPDNLSYNMKNIFIKKLLKQANVSDDTAARVMGDVNYKVNELGKGMISGLVSSMLIVMLLFFAIYFYGYGVAMSVASEKTSRVMEILLTSTKPARIIIGKSAAMGALGLSQLLAFVVVAVVTYSISFPKDFTIGGMSLTFSGFTPVNFVLIFIYFILGYSLFSMLNAVAGASVSKAEDLQSSMMPISMITLVAFYLAYFSVGMPDSTLSIAASIIPFSAPFSMPSRILMTDVPIWELGASLAAMAATIVLTAWASIWLYSHAVLHYGKRLKLKDLVKMSRQ